MLEEPEAIEDGVVEREVETVRTRQHVADAALDALPAAQVVSQRGVGYFETLPERLTAVGFVMRAAIEALLGIRFLILASGANTSSDFAGFIENVSWVFARPFANVFNNRSIGVGVIEPSTLVAMAVYILIFALLGKLVAALTPRLHGLGGRRVLLANLPVTLSPPVPHVERRHTRILAAVHAARRRRRLSRDGVLKTS